MSVRKAVIPAAGLGTRFLPATKSLPKEMIPIVDRPGIQYAVEEAARAGIEDVIIVTGRGKTTMEDHFDRAPELERRLQKSNKIEELAAVRAVENLAEIHYIRQREALGLGHAVGMARAHVGSEAFAVILPDEVVPEPIEGEPPLLERMIEAYEQHGASVVAVQEIARDEVSAYGVVAPAEDVSGDLVRISDFVEKPQPQDAPSNLRSMGRYVLGPEVFDALEATEPGVGNEIQLTDAIKRLVGSTEVYAYIHGGPTFDVGKKLDFLKTTIELALRRDDIGKPFADWLTERVNKL